MNSQREVYVVGHKNPDTDSICSAIAYAALKNQIEEGKFIPRRAGEANSETKYVLDCFGVDMPAHMKDVGTQIGDLSLKSTPPLDRDVSVKNAWKMMKDIGDSTMPVVTDGNLEGIVSVKDIATANMDVYESRILALAKTSYRNVVETLDGEMLIGDIDDMVSDGKILIGAANPELLETYVREGDILLTGNRFESQLCAVEMKAGCIVVCMNSVVSKTIQNLAKAAGCKIIRSPHDTYTTARLISQSTPISYFMRTDELIAFKKTDYVRDVKTILAKIRHRDFPVLEEDGSYAGMFSRRALLDSNKKKIIMVDHNEISQAVDGIAEAELLEIIDHHRLASLETKTPVYFRNQPVGCTATIIYGLYMENGITPEPKMAGLLCSAILSDTLMFRSPTCTPRDRDVAEKLAKLAGVDLQDHAEKMFRAGSGLANKTPEEIFYQDYKKFVTEGLHLGVGQVSSLDFEELERIRPVLQGFMESIVGEKETLFMLLTNILTESSELLYVGEKAGEIIEQAFGTKLTGDRIFLQGVVSRKKQIVPKILEMLQG